ncbi:MAG: T9SS type A sorting domain-containing protein [Bacteroidales bacterium]|nr:T9SS type A sorting domain-containing protein [Bacteroidales bacterium]
MKKHLLSAMLGLIFMFVNYNASSQDWQMLNGQKKSVETKINLLSSEDQQIRLEFAFDAYAMDKVSTSKGEVNLINVPNCSRTKIKGAPDLPKISQAVTIPNSAGMELKIIDSKFIEIDDIDLAPSKGVITRDKDPKTIPYVYGEVYSKDEFYPSNIVKASDPYLIRNVRGQNVTVFPVQYNPVTKKIRIYTHVTVELVEERKGIKNILNVNPKIENDAVFQNVLTNHFINYSSSAKYTPVSETGKNMLIVCYTDFMDEMAEFVTWKESIGYTVNMVNYSTIGSSSALKTYVQNQYDQNGISYLLLVGDGAQVPSSSTSAGDSDNNYGYTSGSDHYLDLFVGRFSADNTTDLQTQIDRTIYYERDVNSSETWFKKGVGVASNEGDGGGGDDNESDEVHMNNIETDLLGFGYTAVDRVYQDGGSAAQLSTALNNGRGIINYVGHGSDYTWASMVYTQANVNALTNENELPVVISVACVVGNFTNKTCFAETWMRATNNGNPTGAIVFYGSTINQSWASPMCAQDEMNDLLVAGTYINNGGMFVNGMFQMIDEYGTDGENMADTWTVFGDPSLQMRTPGQPDGPAGTEPTAPTANFSASETTVLFANTVTFTDQSTQSPTSWSWTFDGGTPSTSTLENPTVTYNTAGTYNVTLTATNAIGSDSETKTSYIEVVSELAVEYCTSIGENFSYEWTAGVTIGSFTNTSAGAGYTDFTSKTVNMTAGTDYAVSLTPGFASTAYNEYWKIWVDLNKDGDFDDANELIFDAGAISNTVVTGTATIPAGTSSKSTRMRVSMKYNAAQTACETFSYGEVEDYTVVISGGVVDTEAPTVPAGLASSNVTSTSATISWNASTDNVGVTAYEVYKDGVLDATVSTTTYDATGLSSGTNYAITVKAKDAAGNISAASSVLNVTTSTSTTTDLTLTITFDNYPEETSWTLKNSVGSTVASGGTYDSQADGSILVIPINNLVDDCYDFTMLDAYSDGMCCSYGSGSYTLEVTGGNTLASGGSFTSSDVTNFCLPAAAFRFDATTSSSFDNVNTQPTINLYPNPANSYINVQVANVKANGLISIYSATGALVKVVEMDENEREVNISDLASGLYLITVDTKKEAITKQFIKR